MTTPRAMRELGKTGVFMPVFGLGGAGLMLGDTSARKGERVFGFRMPSDNEAHRIQEAAWESGLRYWDTSPWYGLGQSEHRVGRFLYDKQDDFTLATKVGRLLKRPAFINHTLEHPPTQSTAFPGFASWAHPDCMMVGAGSLHFDHVHDYTYDGIMRSYEDSMQRMGVNRIDVLVIHDLGNMHMNPRQFDAHMSNLFTSGLRALQELKGAGHIKAFGAAVNNVGNMTTFLDTMDLDFFLVAQCFSMLHHHNEPAMPATTFCDATIEGGAFSEIQRAQERGMGVIASTAFNAGILVTGTKGHTDAKSNHGIVCNYRPATQLELQRVGAMEELCAAHGVPLPAAALQFSLLHPAVTSLITGFGTPEEVRACVEWLAWEIPPALWTAMKTNGFIHSAYPIPSE